jgi:hypothetical protein
VRATSTTAGSSWYARHCLHEETRLLFAPFVPSLLDCLSATRMCCLFLLSVRCLSIMFVYSAGCGPPLLQRA